MLKGPGYREWQRQPPGAPEFCSEWPHTPGYQPIHQPPLPLLLHGEHPGSPSPGLLLGAEDLGPEGCGCFGFALRVPRPGAPRPLCFHRVLGCTPFITVAYFLLWFLPPFTSLRGLWYTSFYCLFQALATVSLSRCSHPHPHPEPGLGLLEPHCRPVATVKGVRRGEGRWPRGTHCPPLLSPLALGASARTGQPGAAGLGLGAEGGQPEPGARASAVLPGALRGAHHAPDPLPEGAGLGHCVP